METELKNVQLNVVQPAGTDGEIKFSTPLTMENIASAVLAEGLASPAEVTQLVAELYELAHTAGSVGCMRRVVEAWGYRSKVPN